MPCFTPTGEPVPEVTWLRADTPLSDQFDTRIEIECDDNDNLHILIIHNASVEDTGDYTIRADNIHGTMSVTVRVVVTAKGQEKPKDKPKEKPKERPKMPQGEGDEAGAPQIVIPPKSVFVDSGKPIFMFSAVTG